MHARTHTRTHARMHTHTHTHTHTSTQQTFSPYNMMGTVTRHNLGLQTNPTDQKNTYANRVNLVRMWHLPRSRDRHRRYCIAICGSLILVLRNKFYHTLELRRTFCDGSVVDLPACTCCILKSVDFYSLQHVSKIYQEKNSWFSFLKKNIGIYG